jgi:biuret amidohydrolase
MTLVEIEDHAEELEALKAALTIEPARTAFVTIDMHRGHLDPVLATSPVLPEESERVLRHAARVLAFAREQGMPAIHVVLTMRPIESGRINPRHMVQGVGRVTMSNRKHVTEPMRQGVPHNLEGSVQTELMPELGVAPTDFLITNKKTLSCFLGTDLELLLRRLGVDTLVLLGINTNTCVQCAAFDSFNHGYKTVVLSDCVASMYGMDLHELGLQNVARCLGWVLTVDELKQKVFEATLASRRQPAAIA